MKVYNNNYFYFYYFSERTVKYAWNFFNIWWKIGLSHLCLIMNFYSICKNKSKADFVIYSAFNLLNSDISIKRNIHFKEESTVSKGNMVLIFQTWKIFRWVNGKVIKIFMYYYPSACHRIKVV